MATDIVMVKCQLDEELFTASYRECNESPVTHYDKIDDTGYYDTMILVIAVNIVTTKCRAMKDKHEWLKL